jgi:predicted amidohydrolase YtcJ
MGIRFGLLARLIALLLVAMVTVGQAPRRPAADLIITNAKVWTVDKSAPTAEAVAILGDRIVAVGLSADVDLWRGPGTKIIDAAGKLLNHGVRLAIGTDWDVAPLNPMLTIYAAVTSAALDDKNPGGWFPEQKLTVAEAIDAYTMGSAYAEFQEKIKGSITPGKLADMVLLRDDILSIDPVKIRDVKVLKTLVGGKLVFDLDSSN